MLLYANIIFKENFQAENKYKLITFIWFGQ